MALSVTRVGARNSTRVQALARDIVARDPSGLLSAFHDLGSRSAFSTSVSADKIEVFGAHAAVIDARAIEQHKAGGDRAAGLRAFRHQQGEWYRRRVRFEAVWLQGRQFVYGALNAGGVGNELYGLFCIVVADPSACRPAALAVFASDSARAYCSPAGVVDRDLALREVAAWGERSHLATVQLADVVLASPRHEWPQILSAGRRSPEVVVAPPPALDSIAAVRMRRTYLARLEELEARAFAGDDTLTRTERLEIAAFQAIAHWRRTHGVAIEGVG